MTYIRVSVVSVTDHDFTRGALSMAQTVFPTPNPGVYPSLGVSSFNGYLA